jgi:8-oxo-dGTP diphosphatase
MISVVMAMIFNGTNQLLIAKRPEHKSYGGLWEFPGGKIEAKESPFDATIREIREELAIQIQPVVQLTSFKHSTDQNITIEFFPVVCEWKDGVLTLNEHTATCWIQPDDFKQYQFAEPDYPAIELLRKHLLDNKLLSQN